MRTAFASTGAFSSRAFTSRMIIPSVNLLRLTHNSLHLTTNPFVLISFFSSSSTCSSPFPSSALLSSGGGRHNSTGSNSTTTSSNNNNNNHGKEDINENMYHIHQQQHHLHEYYNQHHHHQDHHHQDHLHHLQDHEDDNGFFSAQYQYPIVDTAPNNSKPRKLPVKPTLTSSSISQSKSTVNSPISSSNVSVKAPITLASTSSSSTPTSSSSPLALPPTDQKIATTNVVSSSSSFSSIPSSSTPLPSIDVLPVPATSSSSSASSTTTTTSSSPLSPLLPSNNNNSVLLTFSPQQERAIELASQGKSLLLTGPGGTGKSAVIREIKSRLESKGRRVAITATTGAAAVNVGGVTLHSFLKLQPFSTPTSVGKRSKGLAYQSNADELSNLACLIIDEASMLRPDMLACADIVLRGTRRAWHRPFGGLQVIFAGDFFQLPPVLDASYRQLIETEGKPFRKFIFESRLFYELVQHVVDFTVSYRHRDPVLASLLLRIRLGHKAMLQEDRELLLSRVRASLPRDDGIMPTRMYSLNHRVFYENAAELDKLGGKLYTYGVTAAISIDAKLAKVFQARKVLKKKCASQGLGYESVLAHIEAEITVRSGSGGERVALAQKEHTIDGVISGSGSGNNSDINIPEEYRPIAREINAVVDAHLKLGGGGKKQGQQQQQHQQQQQRVAVSLKAKDETDAKKKLKELFATYMKGRLGVSSSSGGKTTATTTTTTTTNNNNRRSASLPADVVFASRVSAGINEEDLFAAASNVADKNASSLSSSSGDNSSSNDLLSSPDDTGETMSSSPTSTSTLFPAMEDSWLLHVKKGAQVMLTANVNMETGLFNGSRGVVEGFRSLKPGGELLPYVKFTAPTTTTNTSKKYHQQNHQQQPTSQGKGTQLSNTHIFCTIPRESKILQEEGLGSVSFTHVPLRLAWASTIHKSQGMSLDRVILSLSSVFEHGQAYVGLSRARTLQGLSLDRLNLDRITADPQVVEFYAHCCSSSSGKDDAGNADTQSLNEAESDTSTNGYEIYRQRMLETLPLEDEWPLPQAPRGGNYRRKGTSTIAGTEGGKMSKGKRVP